MSVELVSSGHLTIDTTVLEDGTVLPRASGGGALYAAIGARLWGHAVGLHCGIGADYPPEFLADLAAAGLDTAGLARAACPSLALWLLHEGNGLKQQVPRLHSGGLRELDAARPPLPPAYLGARGFHLAPATPATQLAVKEAVRRLAPGAVITADIWVESFFDPSLYREPRFAAELTALLPSRKEVEQLWGPDLNRFVRQAGVPVAAVKLDVEGSLVYDARQGRLWHIPIVPVTAKDSTGAGDAYCGGFLAGISATGDALEAGLMGTVSASFAVEEYGALPCLRAGQDEARRRLAALRSRVKERKP